jgi:hypothetical protein
VRAFTVHDALHEGDRFKHSAAVPFTYRVEVAKFAYIQSSDHLQKTRIFAKQEIIRNIHTIWPKMAIPSVIKRSLRVRFTPVAAVDGNIC